MIKSDMLFLAYRIETFIDLVQDPQGYFNRHPDMILPESLDLKITSAALYLLIDCYLRGMGLKMHQRSRTYEEAMEASSSIWEAINEEVDARPYMYPKLKGCLDRGQAAVELDVIVDGFSRWAKDDEDF